MKIFLASRARGQNGSAVVVVLALLGCIGLLLHYNSKTLYILDQDLKLLDSKQQVKYAPASPPATNTAHATPGKSLKPAPQPGADSSTK